MAPGAEHDRRERRWPDDLVERVRRSVAAHAPADDREHRARSELLADLRDRDQPFDELAGPRHVTGSAVMVGRRGTVLHLHKRLRKWLQPGGHVDPGEAPWDAARREAREETGLEVRHPGDGPRLLHVDVHDAAGGHVHLDLRYLLLAEDADPAPPIGESPDVRWCSWEEAIELADVSLRGALMVARGQPEVRAPTVGARKGRS